MATIQGALTPAQIRALLWLPADGAWIKTPRHIAAAVDSLYRYRRGLVEWRHGLYGPRGGYERQWRLTERGIAERGRHDALTETAVGMARAETA